MAGRHVAYLLELLPAVERDIGTLAAPAPFNSDRRLIDDVRAALDWAFFARRSFTVAWRSSPLPSLWLRLSLVSECRKRVEHALAFAVSMSTRRCACA